MYLILAFKTLYNKTLITSPTSFITTLFNDSIASLQPFLLSLKHTNVPQTHTSTFDVCPVAFPRCMACSLLTKDNCCCSFTQPDSTLCNPKDCSTPGLPVPHHLLKFAQVHIHCISNGIQPSHPLMPSSLSTLNLSQHQGLFQ